VRLFKELSWRSREKAIGPCLQPSRSPRQMVCWRQRLKTPVPRRRARRSSWQVPAESHPAGPAPKRPCRASFEHGASTAARWELLAPRGPARRPSTARSPNAAAAAIEARTIDENPDHFLGVQEGQENLRASGGRLTKGTEAGAPVGFSSKRPLQQRLQIDKMRRTGAGAEFPSPATSS